MNSEDGQKRCINKKKRNTKKSSYIASRQESIANTQLTLNIENIEIVDEHWKTYDLIYDISSLIRFYINIYHSIA